MILDMIQGCRMLMEVDGSMIPLEELDDTTWTRKVARGRFDCIDCVYFTMVEGLYLYPGRNMSPKRSRLTKILKEN